jgi:sensor histidine kinase regulating citrate/malate metabolism
MEPAVLAPSECHNRAAMSPEVQRQVFKRSFSTKGKGRGLGTYSMRLLTERHLNGEITFTSDQVSGTTFAVVLPAGGHTPRG